MHDHVISAKLRLPLQDQLLKDQYETKRLKHGFVNEALRYRKFHFPKLRNTSLMFVLYKYHNLADHLENQSFVPDTRFLGAQTRLLNISCM